MLDYEREQFLQNRTGMDCFPYAEPPLYNCKALKVPSNLEKDPHILFIWWQERLVELSFLLWDD